MPKITFCITASHYYPHPGGLEMFVQRLSKELVSQNFKVIVLTHNLKTGHNTIERKSEKLTILRLDAWLLLKGRFPICKNNSRNKEIFQWLKEQNITYFVINTRFYKLSEISAKFSNSLKIIPILIDHGSAHLTIGNKLLDPIVEFVEHNLTNRLKKYKIAYYGISNKSVEWLSHFKISAKGVLPNAINAEEFAKSASKRNIRKELKISKNAFIVYFVGRFTVEKGVLQLLDVAKKISNKNNIHFIFSGKGILSKKIDKLVKNYNVYNIGSTSTKDVSAIMKSSDILCLPSRSEGFCTSLLEACSCKLPSLITHVGGTDELIPNKKYGYIIKKLEPNSIAKKILNIKKNKKELLDIKKVIYDNVLNNYNWKQTVSKIVEACEQSNA